MTDDPMSDRKRDLSPAPAPSPGSVRMTEAQRYALAYISHGATGIPDGRIDAPIRRLLRRRMVEITHENRNTPYHRFLYITDAGRAALRSRV